MSRDELLKRTFQEALDVSMETDFDKLEYRSIPEWDSTAHMRLVALLETKFDVMLSTDQVLDMSSFQKAKEILREHGIEFDA